MLVTTGSSAPLLVIVAFLAFQPCVATLRWSSHLQGSKLEHNGSPEVPGSLFRRHPPHQTAFMPPDPHAHGSLHSNLATLYARANFHLTEIHQLADQHIRGRARRVKVMAEMHRKDAQESEKRTESDILESRLGLLREAHSLAIGRVEQILVRIYTLQHGQITAELKQLVERLKALQRAQTGPPRLREAERTVQWMTEKRRKGQHNQEGGHTRQKGSSG